MSVDDELLSIQKEIDEAEKIRKHICMDKEFSKHIRGRYELIFKEVKTMRDFNLFYNYLKKNVLFLKTKRLGRTAYSFSQMKDYWGNHINKVHYLLDDGFSVRQSNIKNLYRNLIVTE